MNLSSDIGVPIPFFFILHHRQCSALLRRSYIPQPSGNLSQANTCLWNWSQNASVRLHVCARIMERALVDMDRHAHTQALIDTQAHRHAHTDCHIGSPWIGGSDHNDGAQIMFSSDLSGLGTCTAPAESVNRCAPKQTRTQQPPRPPHTPSTPLPFFRSAITPTPLPPHSQPTTYTTEHKPEHTGTMDFGRATRRLLRKVRAGALGGVTGRETPTHNSSAHFRLGCVANPILQHRVSAQYAASSDGQSWNINYESTCSATGVRKKRWTCLAVMALSRRLDRPKRRAGRVTEENFERSRNVGSSHFGSRAKDVKTFSFPVFLFFRFRTCFDDF